MDEKNYIRDIRENLEFSNKTFLYFINTSMLVSYISGALALQIPFANTFGIISYDFKVYLLVGVIVFVFVQLGTIISYFFQITAFTISKDIVNALYHRFGHPSPSSGYARVLLQIVLFIPISCFSICFLLMPNLCSFKPEYSVIIQIFCTFLCIYLTLNLLFNHSPFESHMTSSKFLIIIISVILAINIQNSNIEQYLLTDAVLVDGQSQHHIEVLYLDGDALYYKDGNTYKYLLLNKGSTLLFDNNH